MVPFFVTNFELLLQQLYNQKQLVNKTIRKRLQVACLTNSFEKSTCHSLKKRSVMKRLLYSTFGMKCFQFTNFSIFFPRLKNLAQNVLLSQIIIYYEQESAHHSNNKTTEKKKRHVKIVKCGTIYVYQSFENIKGQETTPRDKNFCTVL